MVILVVIIILVIASPYVYQLFHKDNTIKLADFNNAITVLVNAEKKERTNDSRVFPKKTITHTIIELNTADTVILKTLPGIGTSFAARIVKYRERLGGFCSKEQLKEVFGVDAEKYAGLQTLVRVDASRIKKIAINHAQFQDLSRFPYLSFKQMNAIIQFREQHGNFETMDDMRNIAILDEITLHKIKSYLSFK